MYCLHACLFSDEQPLSWGCAGLKCTFGPHGTCCASPPPPACKRPGLELILSNLISCHAVAGREQVKAFCSPTLTIRLLFFAILGARPVFC